MSGCRFFPYMPIGGDYFSYNGNGEIIGKIVSEGPVNRVPVQNIAKVIYAWWYLNDFKSRGMKSRFPASCTGLTETVLFYLLPNSEIIKDRQHGTGNVAKALHSIELQRGKKIIHQAASGKRLTRADRAAARAAKKAGMSFSTRRKSPKRKSRRKSRRRKSRRKSIRRKSPKRKSIRRESHRRKSRRRKSPRRSVRRRSRRSVRRKSR